MGIRCRCIRVASTDMDALRADATKFVFTFDVDHFGYGPPFFLGPDLVRSTAALLDRIPSSTLLAHYDAQELQEADIYPGDWRPADEEFNLQWLSGHYEKLVTFCNTAAASGDALLLALT